MRIGFLLTGGFLLMAALVSTVGLLSSDTNRDVQQRLRQVSSTAVVDMIAASEMMTSQATGLIAAHNLVSERRAQLAHPETADAIEQEIVRHRLVIGQMTDRLNRAVVQARRTRNQLRTHGTAESVTLSSHKRLIQSLKHLETEFRVHRSLIEQFLALVNTDVDRANEFLESDLQRHYSNALMPAVSTFQSNAEDEFSGEIRRVNEALDADIFRNYAAVLAALLVALSLGLAVSRLIGRPLTKVTRAAVSVGRGNLDARVAGSGLGELGTLVAAFNQMAEYLQKSTISLGEKEVLLREVHHRVKNNLQVVCSLLAMQARETSDAEVARLFEDSQNRVRSMALIHECLYRSDNLARIDFSEYLNRLIGLLRQSHLGATALAPTRGDVRIHVDADNSPLALEQAIPCGLIVNELASNSLKHAFAAEGGDLWVEFRATADRFALIVRDNGVGISADVLDRANSLGLKIVRALVAQLGGELQIDATDGSQFTVRFSRSPDDDSGTLPPSH